MTGKIIKIDQLKQSRNQGQTFYRVYFEMISGDWTKTDIVPGFRNFKRWKNHLKVGNVLSGLRLKGRDTVDADSYPKFVRCEELVKAPAIEKREPVAVQQSLL